MLFHSSIVIRLFVCILTSMHYALHTHVVFYQPDTGEVFTWGGGFYGQLGHRSRRNMYAPRRVEDLVPLSIERVVCGGWHTGMRDTRGSSRSLLFWFFLSSFAPSAVCVGTHCICAAAVTTDGQVHLFGRGSYVASPPTARVLLFALLLLRFLPGLISFTSHIYSAFCVSVVVVVTLTVCLRRFGQLGSGIWGAVAEPTRPSNSDTFFVIDVSLGTEHTLVLASRAPVEQSKEEKQRKEAKAKRESEAKEKREKEQQSKMESEIRAATKPQSAAATGPAAGSGSAPAAAAAATEGVAMRKPTPEVAVGAAAAAARAEQEPKEKA